MSISEAPARAQRRAVRPVPLALVALGVVLAGVALVALPWYAVDAAPAPNPHSGGFLEIPPDADAGRHHGLLTWVLVPATIVVALGTLLPRPALALACRAAAPAVAAAALPWVLVTTLLHVGLVSVGPVPPDWSASPALGVAVEGIALVLLGVGAALGPRPSTS